MLATELREVADKVLMRVLSSQGGEALDDVLNETVGLRGDSSKATFSERDRAWLWEVCAGTLRWKGRLDSVIDAGALKKKPSGRMRRSLQMAAYQLIAQDRTSPGAVVSETVEWIKHREGEATARFANAVLRKIAEHAKEWRELPADSAVTASLPEWFWNRILYNHGAEWASAFARATLERPLLWVREQENPEPKKVEHVPHSGKWIVQDISSQILVSEVTQILREKGLTNPKTLDLCAAPGGKSISLAWSGHRVFATDVSEKRMVLMKENLDRVGLSGKNAANTLHLLDRDRISKEAPYDLVWVDAPCSGSGIIRRHPDVRWLRKESDLAELEKTQLKLLNEAISLVKPGGFLMYSVCSVFKSEGPAQIKKAFGSTASIVREWHLSPHIAPFGDGFYGALLQKPL